MTMSALKKDITPRAPLVQMMAPMATLPLESKTHRDTKDMHKFEISNRTGPIEMQENWLQEDTDFKDIDS